jgi:urease accessory protein UreH
MNFLPVRQYDIPIAQRARGRLALAFRHDAAAARTRIEKFYQEGCLKARLPHPAMPQIAEAITINISGGIAGGDSLASEIDIGPRAAVAITSQAAERVYRALDLLPAQLQTTINVGAGASLDYLPQECILFDGFALDRSLDIDLAGDADFLGVESIVFGRQAMGEAVHFGHLNDRITLRRNGVLLLQDMTRRQYRHGQYPLCGAGSAGAIARHPRCVSRCARRGRRLGLRRRHPDPHPGTERGCLASCCGVGIENLPR